MCMVPVATRREVIVQRYPAHPRVREQAIGEMAPDESRAADNEESFPAHVYRTDSHFVTCVFRAGWLTSRCHTTAQRPSVCGVTRSAFSGGMSTHASAACRGNPPSRPTTPYTLAPTCL